MMNDNIKMMWICVLLMWLFLALGTLVDNLVMEIVFAVLWGVSACFNVYYIVKVMKDE